MGEVFARLLIAVEKSIIHFNSIYKSDSSGAITWDTPIRGLQSSLESVDYLNLLLLFEHTLVQENITGIDVFDIFDQNESICTLRTFAEFFKESK